jgi:hypothetical protein
VQLGLKHRDRRFEKEVYDRHCQGHTVFPKNQLVHALKDVGVILEPDEINGLLMESSNDVDYDQFLQAAKRFRKSSEWSGLLLLHELLADSLPKADGQHPLQVISMLSSREISHVCDAFSYGLKIQLQKSSEDLKSAFEKMAKVQEEQKSNNEERFHVDFTNMEVHNSSMEEVKVLRDNMRHLQILLALSPSDSKVLFKKMQGEHFNDSCPIVQNGKKCTTAAEEWDIVVNSDTTKDDTDKGRQIPNLDKIWSSDAAKGLLHEEVIALVLYTVKMVMCNLPFEKLSFVLAIITELYAFMSFLEVF